MARAINFSRANSVLGAGGIPNVNDLKVWRGHNGRGVLTTISAWKFDPQEIRQIMNQGIGFISVMGEYIPPMRVFGIAPFADEPKPINRITTITQISDISLEGRLLTAAIAKLTTESQTNKTPDEVVGQLNELADHIFKGQKSAEEVVNELFK